jgi:hypothetical protein
MEPVRLAAKAGKAMARPGPAAADALGASVSHITPMGTRGMPAGA